jgi:hypothetical protein
MKKLAIKRNHCAYEPRQESYRMCRDKVRRILSQPRHGPWRVSRVHAAQTGWTPLQSSMWLWTENYLTNWPAYCHSYWWNTATDALKLLLKFAHVHVQGTITAQSIRFLRPGNSWFFSYIQIHYYRQWIITTKWEKVVSWRLTVITVKYKLNMKRYDIWSSQWWSQYRTITNLTSTILYALAFVKRKHWGNVCRLVAGWSTNQNPGKWSGRDVPIPWPSTSPTLIPMNFSLWGFVYESSMPNSLRSLKIRTTREKVYYRWGHLPC